MTQLTENWTMSPDTTSIDSSPRRTNYGEHHNHKPTKAVIGVGILIALSFVLYELNGKTTDVQSSNTPAISRNIASSTQ